MESDAIDAIGDMVSNLKVYHKIGTTDDGRTHHYDPQDHKVVVCSADRNGPGINDDDIEQRIAPPENSTGAWDYVRFVREEVEGLEWAETCVPEEQPEGE